MKDRENERGKQRQRARHKERQTDCVVQKFTTEDDKASREIGLLLRIIGLN